MTESIDALAPLPIISGVGLLYLEGHSLRPGNMAELLRQVQALHVLVRDHRV